MQNMTKFLSMLLALCMMLGIVPAMAEEAAAPAESVAFLMFADGAWVNQVWNPGEVPEGVKATEAVITGDGSYTVGLDFTGTAAGKSEGLSFTALGITNGEVNFPKGMIKINEIRINGQAIEVAKGYTTSDDKVVTRMNILNEWVGDTLPDDAHSWDGSIEDSKPVIVNKDDFAAVETYEVDFEFITLKDTAFIMFASSDWAVSAWNPGEHAETNAVTVNGPGTYTLKLEYAEPLAGYAFIAVGVATGEQTFPGYFIDVTEIKVNGEAIEIAKDFTTTDEGVTTRSNIWNEWVGPVLPEQARIADGNLEGATATIATPEALSNVSSIEVTFDYIYGEPPVVEEDVMTEDELQAALAADYAAYVAVQSQNYIFRNDWYDATYGLNGTTAEYFNRLTGWDADGNAVDYGGTFEDAVITGNGTYTCTMTTGDMGFGTDESLHFFRVTTSIPSKLVADGHITITDATVKIGDGKTQDIIVRTEADYAEIVVRDGYNSVEPSFGNYVPAANTKVVFTFTVNGLAD